MIETDAFFLQLRHGRRFCLLHSPSGSVTASGAILFVHSFAEEMNKSRRMAANQARMFAQVGWVVLQIDLFGCGDSDGDFVDATWQHWVHDIVDASAWLHAKTAYQPVLWGLRTGCLALAQAAHSIAGVSEMLLWQPTVSGKQFLQRFLRLKIANKVLADTPGERSGTQQLRQQLARGESVEVAGYALSPGMALGMEAADLILSAANLRIGWFEVSASEGNELGPISSMQIAAYRDAGHRVDARVVHGPAFWHTQEISECPELIAETLSLLREWRG